jgi:aminopeptidase YwaD
VNRKLIWFTTTDTMAATIFFVEDSVLPKKMSKVSAKVQAQFVPAFTTQNVLGFVPGTEQSDRFVIFSAHYDHLGEMGKGTIFPGASDNASGVAVLLSLARYYAAHPAKYSIAFMSFSGEEAGLIGSGYYVMNPVFPLQQTRFLVNLDIAGDATRGITVVNANEQQTRNRYALLEKINQEHHFLPSLAARGQAKISDHYQFAKKGVPAVYIYTNGAKPWYHDTRDKPKELGFEQVDGLLGLLKEFLKQL